MTVAPKSEAIAGKLYGLLAERLPICCSVAGVLQVATLAERLRMSPEGVYRWLRSNEISKRGRDRLIALSEADDNCAALEEGLSPLSETDLHPFL